MTDLDTVREEIVRLHDFFQGWYCGEIEPTEFDRFEASLADSFEIITPEGTLLDRASIVAYVDDGREQYPPENFEITIDNVEIIASFDRAIVARYEEWQTDPDETTGRVSTVLLAVSDSAPNGLSWKTVHETWIEA